jgi:hypothetical protein
LSVSFPYPVYLGTKQALRRRALGRAASVISELLIAYLRPGAAIIPESRGFSTSSPALNFALEAHAFISVALLVFGWIEPYLPQGVWAFCN